MPFHRERLTTESFVESEMPVRSGKTALVLASTIVVSACGLKVPDLQEFGRDQNVDPQLPSREALSENTILNHLKCEIHLGVQSVIDDPNFVGNPRGGRKPSWLIGTGVGTDLGWGAKVSYVLTADEKNQFNPGLSYTNPFAKMGTLFSLSGGIQSSAEARRKETGAVTYAFADLMNREARIPATGCENQDGVLIRSNLKIADFIRNKVFVTRVPGTTPDDAVTIDSGPPQILNAFSDEITFTIIYGASITPSWVFVRLSVNPEAPLLSAERTKTQYVTITVAPILTRSSRQSAAKISEEGQLIDSANLIGHSVASAIRSLSQGRSLNTR